MRARFEREARAISALNDPHICALYNVGSGNGLDYLVMELCDGATLADRLRGGRLQLEQALRFGVQIALALENAHQSGVPGLAHLIDSCIKTLRAQRIEDLLLDRESNLCEGIRLSRQASIRISGL